MKRVLFFLAVILVFLLLSSDSAYARKIAFTFDDGPSPLYTKRLLKILAVHLAKATFFVKGENAERYPEILRAEFCAGHEIGNHAYSHPRLTEIGKESAKRQIEMTQKAVFKVIRIWPKYFRPPYSAKNSGVEDVVKSLGLKMARWEVSPEDYKCEPPEIIAKKVLSAIRPGMKRTVVVMHDNCPHTPEAVDIILGDLEKKGFEFVTLSDLEK